MAEQEGSGNTKEDWEIFEILVGADKKEKMEESESAHDMNTALKSEVAALQYKKDRLSSELGEVKNALRCRENRLHELQVETDNLREQSARQMAIIDSLKKRLKDQEDRERDLYAAQGRTDMVLQALQRDCRFHEDRSKELEQKLRNVEVECSSQEQKKEAARNAFQDLLKRLSISLGVDCYEGIHMNPDSLVLKASEIVQEAARLKSRANNLGDTCSTIELELKNAREALERALSENESLQRQSANQMIELDRLRHDKEDLEMHYRVAERERSDLREKLADSTKSLGHASGNIAHQESTICNLRDELKIKEEKLVRAQNEVRHLLESLAIQLSGPSRFVESHEGAIKERLRELLLENKEKSDQLEVLKEKLTIEQQQLNRQSILQEQAASKIRLLEDERNILETRMHKLEAELNGCEMTKDGLKRDKMTFMTFLERLARALNMDEISQELGVDLHTESLLVRAEQLARLESDKIVDKTATVYQLQRRCRTLREQVQRKDLHLDLLRRKLAIQEDAAKVKVVLQNERDEANVRIKKLLKQVERLQIQLADSKSQCRDLNAQLAEAADYKITALERGRKVEELQKRLVESEMLRNRYNKKVHLLKENLRSTDETIEHQKSITCNSIMVLREELARTKSTLEEISRREGQLQTFKNSVAKILGIVLPMPDFELLSRLQKIIDAYHEYGCVSRRYDEAILPLTSRSPTPGVVSRMSRTPERSRYDDSGYHDTGDLFEDYLKN